ncbi:MAG: pyridoxal phosphate-dependent aminotransferase [Clostridia bacterium]|nr:pyridoxal phosphate-dependent aminotransferase [Clostridia bacterium]
MSLSLSKAALEIKPSATLKINAAVNRLRAEGVAVLSLGAGEPDFDTPKHVCQAAIRAIQTGQTRYTEVSGILSLRRAVCAYMEKEKGLHYAPEEILVGSGAKQVLLAALKAVLDSQDEVIVPSPYWVSYPEMIRIADGVPVIVPADDDFLPQAEALAQAITPRTKAIIVNTPCNPTGIVWHKKLLENVMELARKHDLFVISDEIYESFLYDGTAHLSPASLSEDARSRTIVISGVSKTYAMTGWRIGYAAGSRSVISAMSAIQSHTAGNACSISQHAALAALDGSQECVEKMREAFLNRRSLLIKCLSRENLQPACIPQGAFYVLLDIRPFFGKRLGDTSIDSDVSFCEALLNHSHVALTPGCAFGLEGFVRISYAAADETICKAVRRIGRFIRFLK